MNAITLKTMKNLNILSSRPTQLMNGQTLTALVPSQYASHTITIADVFHAECDSKKSEGPSFR